MKIGVITLASPMHGDLPVPPAMEALARQAEVIPITVDQVAEVDLPLFLIRTGGTEEQFVRVLGTMPDARDPLTLLAVESDNSLPASLEILAWARRHGVRGARIVPAGASDVRQQLEERCRLVQAARALAASRVGVVGLPSDWLIASQVDHRQAAARWGVQFEPVVIDPILDRVRGLPPSEGGSCSTAACLCTKSAHRLAEKDLQAWGECSLRDAMAVYEALRDIASLRRLTALTVRCFDLIGPLAATGCLALSLLNDDGIVAGCEGDVPAVFSMILARIVSGGASFMANPGEICGDEVLFAHCTVPLSLTTCSSLDTHFESGLGLAVRGSLRPGPITVLRVGGEGLDEHLVLEGEAVAAPASPHHCRTQVRTRVPGLGEMLLSRPLGNHHVIVPGHHRRALEAVLALGGSRPVTAW